MWLQLLLKFVSHCPKVAFYRWTFYIVTPISEMFAPGNKNYMWIKLKSNLWMQEWLEEDLVTTTQPLWQLHGEHNRIIRILLYMLREVAAVGETWPFPHKHLFGFYLVTAVDCLFLTSIARVRIFLCAWLRLCVCKRRP